MLFQEMVKLGQNSAIVLCRASNASGKKFFHFIKANKDSLKLMLRDYEEKKVVDFSSYGEIVHSGWGEEPSAEDERIVNEKFPDFKL